MLYSMQCQCNECKKRREECRKRWHDDWIWDIKRIRQELKLAIMEVRWASRREPSHKHPHNPLKPHKISPNHRIPAGITGL